MFFLTLYNEIVYRPLLNLMVFLYNVIPGHDIGVVIILLTVLIRLILAPSSQKSLKSQKALTELQPKLKEIQNKYKDNKEEQARATMQLYKDNNINPFASCLPLLIQLPLIFALYQVFSQALNNHLTGLYSFVKAPASIDPSFLGLVNLSQIAWKNPGFNWPALAESFQHIYWAALALCVLAGVAQFVQSKMMLPKTQSSPDDYMARSMRWQTTYLLPIILPFFALGLPSGLALYWVVSTLFGVVQQYYINADHEKKPIK